MSRAYWLFVATASDSTSLCSGVRVRKLKKKGHATGTERYAVSEDVTTFISSIRIKEVSSYLKGISILQAF